MPTKDEINTALPERAQPLWDIEDCFKKINTLIPLLCDHVLLTQAEMELSPGKCKVVDKDLETMMMAIKVADACVDKFHKRANKTIRAEDDLIIPLSGGGGKGDDNDDDLGDGGG